MDIEDRVARRLTETIEHYVSVSASAAIPGRPRRLVATVSNPTATLWEVGIAPGTVEELEAIRVPGVPTALAAAPRFASDSVVLYLASRGGADGLWRLGHDGARELWKASDGAVAGAPALSPDGEHECLPVRRQKRTSLVCMTGEGSGVHALAESLDVRGAGSWSPDGQWIAIAAKGRRAGPDLQDPGRWQSARTPRGLGIVESGLGPGRDIYRVLRHPTRAERRSEGRNAGRPALSAAAPLC